MTSRNSILMMALGASVFIGCAHPASAVPAQGDEKSGGKHAEATGSVDAGPSRVVHGRNDIEGEIIGTPANGSPFAKLEIGMTQEDASDRLAMGKQCGGYRTGKEWIPFRFSSNDVMRTECNYQGLGRLIFTQGKHGSFLLKIVNDASESGIRD